MTLGNAASAKVRLIRWVLDETRRTKRDAEAGST
jgi:hypothetical protein